MSVVYTVSGPWCSGIAAEVTKTEIIVGKNAWLSVPFMLAPASGHGAVSLLPDPRAATLLSHRAPRFTKKSYNLKRAFLGTKEKVKED